jgi:predicted DNA-binding protein with PD1-like motif
VKVRLLAVWFLVRGSYWFVPALMAAVAVGLSALTLAVDDVLRDRALAGLAWVYAGGPDGARALLSTIAGSMITVAALVFSITMVVLSQASSQLGPHVLTLFMRDTGNQVVLGTFLATFIYCMLVLRTGRAAPPFVPHVSVTMAITLAMAGLGVLIYFIHHTAVGIQADTVIAAVAILVFDRGDEVIAELTAFARAQRLSASHFTAIGALQEVTLGYFQPDRRDYKRIAIGEQVEVLSLVGDIALKDGEPKVHAHVVVGKSDGTAHGGHLLLARVWPTLELILTESPKHLRRRSDEATGLALIDLSAT